LLKLNSVLFTELSQTTTNWYSVINCSTGGKKKNLLIDGPPRVVLSTCRPYIPFSAPLFLPLNAHSTLTPFSAPPLSLFQNYFALHIPVLCFCFWIYLDLTSSLTIREVKIHF
jgi:hypothetical protein